MNAKESMEEMAAMLMDEGLIYLKVCERCKQAFSTANGDEGVCSICARLHRILSTVEVGGDG